MLHIKDRSLTPEQTFFEGSGQKIDDSPEILKHEIRIVVAVGTPLHVKKEPESRILFRTLVDVEVVGHEPVSRS